MKSPTLDCKGWGYTFDTMGTKEAYKYHFKTPLRGGGGSGQYVILHLGHNFLAGEKREPYLVHITNYLFK